MYNAQRQRFMPDLSERIYSSLIAELYDVPIMSNFVRADYVERMIVFGLGGGFELMSADYAGWDIEGPNEIRIEVKQSTARQTWTDRPSHTGTPATGSFDIAPRQGYYTDGGSKWVPVTGRNAHIYILAWHPVFDEYEADHRDQMQWLFFVVLAEQLPPNQKTISRTVVEKKWKSVRFEKLRNTVLDSLKGLPD